MKRKFDLVTDSACDLPENYYLEHEIDCIPLGFTMNGVSYEGEDGEHLDVEEFYADLRAGAMPKTFQASPEQVASHFKTHLEAGRDVLAIAFSSGLSGTYQSYLTAAKELKAEYPARKIVVVDSLCASLGQGLFVDYIVKRSDMGATLEETRAYAEDLKQHICHYFTVDDLFHLKRGGRVSAATAVVGSLLKIKPVLHVDHEGHLIPIAKAMGRKKSISALVDYMRDLNILEAGEPVFISHGDCFEDVEYLKRLLKETFGDLEIFVNEIGSVIGTHSGAGTLALFFRGEHR